MERQAPYTPDDNDYNPMDEISYITQVMEGSVQRLEKLSGDTDSLTYVIIYVILNSIKDMVEELMNKMKPKVIGYVTVAEIKTMGVSVSYSQRKNYKFEQDPTYADFSERTKLEKKRIEEGIKLATDRGKRIVTDDGEYYDPVEMTTTVFPVIKKDKK